MLRSIPSCCLDLVHHFEGRAGEHEAMPVQDPVGNWEIGWSHKIKGPDFPGAPISRAYSDQLALNDLSVAADVVHGALGDTTVQGLTEGQWGALICFTFNEGGPNFLGSTLCRMVRFAQYPQAADQFGRWIYATKPDGTKVVEPGLILRRAAEKAMFLS